MGERFSGSLSLTTALPVASGGTGAATLTSGNVLVGAATSAITATKTAPSGDFVGTSDTQTLTNKTVSDTLLCDDIDTSSATTLQLGKSTATRVEIGDTGIITDIEGPVECPEGVTLTGALDSTEMLNVNVTGDSEDRLLIRADGEIRYGVGSSVPVWRINQASNVIRQARHTDNATNLTMRMFGLHDWRTNTGTDFPFLVRVNGDSNARFAMRTTGEMTWGSGSTTTDVALERSTTNTLLVSDGGSSFAAILQTDGRITARQNATTDGAFSALVSGDSSARYVVRTDGDIEWGDGTTRDTRLVRSAASELTLDDNAAGAANLIISGGIQVQTSGGTASTLNHYEETTHSTDWTGAWTLDQTGNLTVTRIGRQVTLIFPATLAAGGGGGGVITNVTALATRFRPSVTIRFFIYVRDNGTEEIGNAIIESTGTITMGRGAAGGSFTGSAGSTGFREGTCTYTV